MLDTYSISAGRAAPSSLEKSEPSKTSLTICAMPSDEEISRIAKKLEISQDVVKEAIHKSTGPRIAIDDECLRITYRAPHIWNSRITTTPAVLLIKKNIIVAVFRSPLKKVESLHAGLSQGLSPPIFKEGVVGIVASIIDKINDEFCDMIDEISAHAENFEKRLHGLSREDAAKIYSINMTLAYFQRALAGNRELLKEISASEVPGLSGPRVRSIFSELHKDVTEIIDAEEIQRSTINNIFTIHTSIVSNELNAVMKQLTAIGAIILFPTFIAAIYGMNISGLPFAKSEYGFHMISLILAAGAGMIALYFRRKKWL